MTRAADHSPQSTIPTKNMLPLRDRRGPLDIRVANGVSIGGIVGACIGTVIGFALIFGLLFWLFKPKMK
jgi:hypothetical protein